MAWPNEIYVATSNLGVYYTDDFVDPTTQPTWSAVNTGLPALDCREFELDPFNESTRQYTLLEANRTIYRRESGGNWASILSPADCRTLIGVTGGHIGGFGMDKTIEGRMWATFGSASTVSEPEGYYALHSNDYGSTWNHQGKFYSHYAYTYGLGSVLAQGNNVYVMASTGAGGNATIYYSTNGGASWGSKRVTVNAVWPIFLNTLLPTRVYVRSDFSSVDPQRYLTYVTNGGVQVDLQSQMAPDSMWFDPDDASHQRLLRSEGHFFDARMYYTYDNWATFGYVSKNINSLSMAPYAGNDVENMLYGLKVVTDPDDPYYNPYVIGAVYGETETTVVPISGESPETSPYTDSIPLTCGVGIVRAIGVSGAVYTYDVDFEGDLVGAGVYPFGVDFGEEIGSNKVSVHNVEME